LKLNFCSCTTCNNYCPCSQIDSSPGNKSKIAQEVSMSSPVTGLIHRILFQRIPFGTTFFQQQQQLAMQRQSTTTCVRRFFLCLLVFLVATLGADATLRTTISPGWSMQQFGIRKIQGKTDRGRKQALPFTGRSSASRQSRQEGLPAAGTIKQELLIQLSHSVRL
jgi:hypothetical protein